MFPLWAMVTAFFSEFTMSIHSICLSADHSLLVRRVVIASFDRNSKKFVVSVADPRNPLIRDDGKFRSLQKLREFLESHDLNLPDALYEHLFADSDDACPVSWKWFRWSKSGAIIGQKMAA
jgi:hypothetical protein